MSQIPLELKIISAKGLNKVNLLGKMALYAVVYITGNGNQDQKQKTNVDKDGDSNPTWNHPMKFTMDEHAALQNRLTLVVDIKAEGVFGDKDVGEVHVPVKELMDCYSVGGKPLQFVSYQVTKPNGKPKGELNFSCKFGEKWVSVGTAYPAGKYDKLDETDMNSFLYPPRYTAPPDAGFGIYPPPPACIYPPVGGTHYPLSDGYPYQQQGYGVYPPPPPLGYGGYPPLAGYGYPPVQQPQSLGTII